MNRSLFMTLFICLLATVAVTGCGKKSSTPAYTSTVTALSVAPANQQVTLSWTKSATSKATGFNVYWSTSPSVTKTSGKKIANVTSPYIHSGLSNDTIYYYVITETTDTAEGPESQQGGAAPKADIPARPSGITITALEESVRLTLVRTTATTNAKYNVYWSLDTVPAPVPTKIVNAFGSGSTFLHTGLSNGKRYKYAVTVETPDGGESAQSTAMVAIPTAALPMTDYLNGVSIAGIAAPVSVSATAKNQAVSLSWDMPAKSIPTSFDPANAPASGKTPIISAYTVYWSREYITPASQAFRIITLPATASTKLPFTFDHTAELSNDTLFYYTVRATAATDKDGSALKRADGTLLDAFISGFGGQVGVVPSVRTPAPPSGLTATSGLQQIALKWNKDASTSTYYKMYYDTTLRSPDELISKGKLVTIPTGTTYTHTGLQSSTTYYYVITAVDEAESVPSALIAFSMP